MNEGWEVFDGELPNGKEVTVYYDHRTSLTVVPDYAQGRTLIFHDGDLNNENLGEDVMVSCIVENNVLDNQTPEEVFADARKQAKEGK